MPKFNALARAELQGLLLSASAPGDRPIANQRSKGQQGSRLNGIEGGQVALGVAEFVEGDRQDALGVVAQAEVGFDEGEEGDRPLESVLAVGEDGRGLQGCGLQGCMGASSP